MFLARPEVSRNSVHGYSVMGCCLAPHNHWFGLARISMDTSGNTCSKTLEHVFLIVGARLRTLERCSQRPMVRERVWEMSQGCRNHWFGPARIFMDPLELVFQRPLVA